ncbi:unnamed protein product [Cylindrotheca closterium]|uniref:Uncharacterized protein n=1 Tax=Cylindrotheca closterium TaxID=2856 RepID=A0AAD2CC80_9STRA|nr:unnamed protein product [Cylindrotheca closterium]
MSTTNTPITPVGKQSAPQSDTANESEVEDKVIVEPANVATTPFSNDDIQVISSLVWVKYNTSKRKEIRDFLNSAGISTWGKLEGGDFSEIEFDPNINPFTNLKKQMTRQRFIKVLTYAALTKQRLSSSLTFSEVNKTLKEMSSTPSSPTDSSSSSSSKSGTDNRPFKLQVPDLPAFSGRTDQYPGWKRKIMHELGKRALWNVLDSDDYHAKNPQISEAIFSAIAAALSDGLASPLSKELESAKEFNARNCILSLKRVLILLQIERTTLSMQLKI